jgi:hypothetical protein
LEKVEQKPPVLLFGKKLKRSKSKIWINLSERLNKSKIWINLSERLKKSKNLIPLLEKSYSEVSAKNIQ